MLRRRLFVIVIIAFAAVITAAKAEPVKRKFFASRRAKIDCTDDPGGTNDSPCRRSIETGNVELVTPKTSTEDQGLWNGAILPTDDQLPVGNVIDDPTAIVEGRKKKRRGLLKIFFMMAAAAKATLLYVMIHAVALVAGKALVVAKVALALAAAVALKKALGEHHEKTSYEIVKHPHHSYVQTHSASVDYDHHERGGSGYEGGHRRRRRYAR